MPRLSIAEVLNGFRAAGCLDAKWFEVVDEPAGSRLPECPGTAVRFGGGALDLGEVSVCTAGRTSSPPAVVAPLPSNRAGMGGLVRLTAALP